MDTNWTRRRLSPFSPHLWFPPSQKGEEGRAELEVETGSKYIFISTIHNQSNNPVEETIIFINVSHSPHYVHAHPHHKLYRILSQHQAVNKLSTD